MDSTNLRASELADKGSPHGTLVVTDEQTAGRGRDGKRWWTPSGCALAFSLVLRPESLTPREARALVALGTVAVAEAIEARGGEAKIKWPNDVLLDDRKVAGILVETSWLGDKAEYAVLGVGINVRHGSIPTGMALDYPATYLEDAVGEKVERTQLLLSTLESLGRWLPMLASDAFLEAWDRRLAFRGRQVEIEVAEGIARGEVLGLTSEGKLRLIRADGEEVVIGDAGSRLRPVDMRLE